MERMPAHACPRPARCRLMPLAVQLKPVACMHASPARLQVHSMLTHCSSCWRAREQGACNLLVYLLQAEGDGTHRPSSSPEYEATSAAAPAARGGAPEIWPAEEEMEGGRLQDTAQMGLPAAGNVADDSGANAPRAQTQAQVGLNLDQQKCVWPLFFLLSWQRRGKKVQTAAIPGACCAH